MNRNEIVYFSGFVVGDSSKPLQYFLDDTDSLWCSLDEYGKENFLITEQIFFIRGREIITKTKGTTNFKFYPRCKIAELIIYLLRKRQRIMIFQINDNRPISIFISILMKMSGVHIINFLHNFEDFSAPSNSIKGFLKKFLLPIYLNLMSDTVVVPTDYHKKKISNFIKRPICIFHFGIDVKEQKLKERINGSFKILFIGRLNPVKKIEDIIKAISLVESKERIEFWIVGDGDKGYGDSLKLLLEKEKVNHRFFGFVQLSKLSDFYSEADLFVNLRPDETFGKVFIESMAHGLPVMGRRGAPGPEEIIQERGNGFLVKDIEGAANILSEVIKDISTLQSMRENCYGFIKENYSYKKSYQSFQSIYDRILVEFLFNEGLSLKAKCLRFVRKATKREIFDIEEIYAINNGNLIHREHLALYPYCEGRGIDVGCGGNKIHPDAIGVDIIPKGKKGFFGSQQKIISQADIQSSGDNLNMFKDGELDYVVASHNLEHYKDLVKTLIEWKRVLKPGGVLGVILPDDTKINTIKLDPTHKHVFIPESFKNLVEIVGGFEIIRLEECIKDWSFLCVAKKKQ